MELVDGPSLDDVLRESGTLDPREAAGIGAKVMDALSAAHRAGVLHRDVKPGNILLDRSGRVVLTDFGIATMDDPGDGSATHLTRSGELVGSLDYLAPERAQGAEPGPASDIWALGATLYAAVEGASPFRRTSTFSTLTAIVTEPLPEPLRAGALAPVLQRLMEKRPEARPEAGQAESCSSRWRTRALRTRRHLRCEALRCRPRPRARRRSGVFRRCRRGSDHRSSRTPPGPTRPRTHRAPGRLRPSEPPGPPGRPASGSGPYGPGTSPHGFGPSDPDTTGPGASAPTGPVNSGRPPRRKSRGLLAAAALTVVLAAAGATVAVLSNSDGKETGARTDAARADAGSSSAPGRTDDGSNAPRPTQQGDEKGKAPSKKPGDKKAPEPATSAPSKSSGTTGGTPDGTSDGSDTGGGSGNGGTGDAPTTPAPEPACHAIGGGKYNCQVWKTADSYTASGTKVGVLNAGTNYFYCQQNLGRRETDGRWTNVWWAKTDDDSGNTNVWVSDVYVKGGDNDAPVPGLPVC